MRPKAQAIYRESDSKQAPHHATTVGLAPSAENIKEGPIITVFLRPREQ